MASLTDLQGSDLAASSIVAMNSSSPAAPPWWGSTCNIVLLTISIFLPLHTRWTRVNEH